MPGTIRRVCTDSLGPILDAGDTAVDKISPCGNYILPSEMRFIPNFISFSQLLEIALTSVFSFKPEYPRADGLLIQQILEYCARHWGDTREQNEHTISLHRSTVLCVSKMEADLSGFNIDVPRWDQRTFLGRVKHFLNITDPRTVFVSERELDWAKVMVEKSRMGVVPPGTQVEQLLYAKKLYDSAFHPDTGEKMNIIGRMSFQLPGGMIITGFMLQFYRTTPAVIFWQWVNQSFNALVNYTNRNAASPTSVRQMALSYFTATTTAVATAVGMNMLTKRAPPLVGRWVPFAAVAAANCVNIPMMRQ
ncbi:Sideroflexin-2, partial [Plecturocebus cupreus]